MGALVFDPNESTDENNEEYKKIYDEYKHLVDFMLGSFMEEMQITPEQFGNWLCWFFYLK